MEKCMGCLGLVFGSRGRRSRLRYKVNYGNRRGENGGIEFDNLILDDDDHTMNYGTSHHFISQEEKEIIAKREYDKIMEQQRKIDEQISRKTYEEEERIRIEEDRFHEAQLEASRAVSAALKVQKYSKGNPKSQNLPDSTLYSIGDSDESDDDDFESFLRSVKTRSDAFRQNKSEILKTVTPSSADNNNTPKIISSQPKKLDPDFTDREIDGIADGMSSDGSFIYDDLPTESKNQPPDSEWDTFVDGLEKPHISEENELQSAHEEATA